MSEFKKRRKEIKMSVENLAAHLGYSPRTLERWDQGKSVPRKSVWDMMDAIEEGL